MSAVDVRVERPFANEAEDAVLGAVIVKNSALAEVASILRPDHFGQHWGRVIFQTMLGLAKENKPIDLVTIRTALGARAADELGATRLAKLVHGIPGATNVTYYADLVIDAARRREAIDRAVDVIAAAVAPGAEADDVVGLAQESFFRLAQTKRGETLWSAESMTGTLYKRLEAMDERKHAMTGLSTGIHDLDAITHGFQPGELVIIGARPSVGKTGLALQLGLHAAKTGGVLFCSLEMGQASVWDRALFNVARVDGFKFKRGQLRGDPQTSTRISNALAALPPLRFWLDDQPGMSSIDVRSKAQQIQLRHGLNLVIVDYLQLMRPADPKAIKDQTRSQWIGDIAKDLKEIARALNVTVVLLSQLRRIDGRPTMSDIRESGDVEAHADIVLLLHRVETREQLNELNLGEPAHIELLIEKQRGNPTGVIRLLNFREQYRFASETRGDRDPHEDGTLFDHMERTA